MLGIHGGDIPGGTDERAELFRSLLAGRRLLILLDDVAGEQDVVPLLPGSTSCAVLITSRRRLPGLAAAAVVDLGRFSPEQSLELLTRVVGGDRVRQETAVATTLAEQCGHLPLALRIAGARLAVRPHWTVQQMAVRLADEERRLDELVHGGMAIRASISLNHDALSEPARRLFRLLAILDAHVYSGWTAAALLGLPLTAAQEALDELVDAQLVQPLLPGHGLLTQYRFHDLVRGFARQRLAADEPPASADAALVRALDATLALTRTVTGPAMAAEVLAGPARTPEWVPPQMLVDAVTGDAMDWLERERPAILAAVHQAARAGLAELCYGIAMAVQPFLSLRAYHDDSHAMLSAALDVCLRTGDRRGEAMMLFALRTELVGIHDQDNALRDLGRAELLFRELDDRHGIAASVRAQAFVAYLHGRTTTALALFGQALEMTRAMYRDGETAYILQILGAIQLLHGSVDDARRILAEAIIPARAWNKPMVVAQVLYRTGQAHLQAREPEAAVAVLQEALTLTRGSGDPTGEAHILVELARAELQFGAKDAASALLDIAVARARTGRDALSEGHALSAMAELGSAEHAVDHLTQAVERYRAAGGRVHEARALIELARAQHAAGDADAADATRAQATQLIDRTEGALRDRLRMSVTRTF
jgi:hypothetical protein